MRARSYPPQDPRPARSVRRARITAADSSRLRSKCREHRRGGEGPDRKQEGVVPVAKYCAGLPQVGMRKLTVDEIVGLRQESKALSRTSLLLWLVIPFAMFSWLAATASLPEHDRDV